MVKLPAQKMVPKKGLTPTSLAFQRLLNWLDGGTSSDGKSYLEMQRRLISYFDRRNCSTPDELADLTLNRVARRLEEEQITDDEYPAKYCYIVARFVFMEHLRAAHQDNALLDDLGRQLAQPLFQPEDDRQIKERMLDCLEQCTRKLEPGNREIIIGYYAGKERAKIENRRALAANLGITSNALSIRACRIRDKLQACVEQCTGGK
jgi:DNA-directed RNA polymerase specialized sigma24 family protein